MDAAQFEAKFGEKDANFFHELDTNKDGVLSRREWQLGFDILDADGDGEITLEEWLRKGGDQDQFIMAATIMDSFGDAFFATPRGATQLEYFLVSIRAFSHFGTGGLTSSRCNLV